jgi:hypothetical protein
LTDITEYGDVMLDAYVDEWGRRRIDGLLEDGTRIILVSGGQVCELFFCANVEGLAHDAQQCLFDVERDADVASVALRSAESNYHVLRDAEASASVLAGQIQSMFNIQRDVVVVPLSPLQVQSMLNVSFEAGVRVFGGVSVVKKDETKVVRLFLVLGNVVVEVKTGELGLAL